MVVRSTKKEWMNPIHSFFVHPMRIELISSEPESGILSIELRVLHEKTVQKYIKSFCLPNK